MATLDVRAMMREGGEPFQAIMSAVENLAAAEDFELLAPLDPEPLKQLLLTRGFTPETEALGGGDFRVLFRRREA